MNFSIKGFISAVCALIIPCLYVLMSQTAPAMSQTTTASTEYVSIVETISVNPDGSSVSEWEIERRLLDVGARDDIAQVTFRFNDQRSTIDILEAETIKASGTRVKVKPDQIRLQEDAATISMPMFSTSKMKTVIFPDVEVGDTVHYRVKQTETEPDFAGHFNYIDSITPDIRVISSKLTIIAPASLKLRTEVVGYDETRQTGPNGEQILSWTFSQPNVRPYGNYKANVFFQSPHLIVTSFASWAELAAAQGKSYVGKTDVDAEIQALADQITEGTSDRREQTKRLYSWVRGNIRYVALYLAHGGYVPHFASDVLHNRYGDCKDHVVLLEALLRAKGIDSHGVIIKSGEPLYNVGSLPMPYFFDHIITYLPEFDLYVDATNQYLPFGELGYSLSKKQVLHLDGATGLKQMPALDVSGNKQTTNLQLELGLDGSVKGQSDIVSTGDIALNQRYFIAGINPLDRADAVHDSLSANGLQGSGTFDADRPDGDDSPFHMKVDFSVEAMGLDLSGPEAVELQVPVFNLYTISGATRFSTELPDSIYSRACMGMSIADIYKITLPQGIQVVALPKPISLTSGPIKYESTYENDGKQISATRRYTMSINKGYCTPEELAGMNEAAKLIRRDLQRKILLKPADS